eukprot:scaffold19799_cov69-Phaeocystis_antarctica.AAC.7
MRLNSVRHRIKKRPASRPQSARARRSAPRCSLALLRGELVAQQRALLGRGKLGHLRVDLPHREGAEAAAAVVGEVAVMQLLRLLVVVAEVELVVRGRVGRRVEATVLILVAEAAEATEGAELGGQQRAERGRHQLAEALRSARQRHKGEQAAEAAEHEQHEPAAAAHLGGAAEDAWAAELLAGALLGRGVGDGHDRHARAIVRGALVAEVTLVVLLGARAVLAELDALVLLPVEARRRAPAPRVAHLVAEQALAALPAVGGRPQLVVRGGVARILDALARLLVHRAEVELVDHAQVAARAVHDEDLRGGLGLDDDVLDLGARVGVVQLVPRHGLVPREVDLGARLAVVGDDDDGAVVAVLVDVRALAHHRPAQAGVAAEEGVHLVLLGGEVVPHVARGHDEADCVLARVEGAPRVGDAVQVQRARGVIVLPAGEVAPLVGGQRRLEHLPLAALVEGDLGAQPRLLVPAALQVRLGVDLLVGDVDALDALQLLKVAPPLRVALVVPQREREAQPLGI